MIHAYHVIWGAYGFWLPKRSTRLVVRLCRVMGVSPLWPDDAFDPAPRYRPRAMDDMAGRRRRASGSRRSNLPVAALAIGSGFSIGVRKSRFTIWACSILPEHVHLVIARHTYKVEQICNLLKGEATKQLKAESLHPQQRFQCGNGKLPSLWAEGQWKVYLDSEEAIEEAIHYVEENPTKEGKPLQNGRLSRLSPASTSPAGRRTTNSFNPEPTATARRQRHRRRWLRVKRMTATARRRRHLLVK